EVDAACGPDTEAARAASRVWGVTAEGNFEGSGATVLSVMASPAGEAETAALERARKAMFAVREARPKPFRDEKLLASWNGLMIGALAEAGAALDPSLVRMAVAAMEYVDRVLVEHDANGNARVKRLAKDGVAKGHGFLDDLAYLADAAIDLYEATGDPRWVTLARALARSIVAHHLDPSDGGFFFVPDDGETILVRAKDPYDHAVPSGASVACRALSRLGTLVDPRLGEIATRAIETLGPAAERNPAGMSNSVLLADRVVRGSTDVVLVGPRSAEGTRALAGAVFRANIRYRVLAWADPADPASIEACSVLAEGKLGHPGPLAYVCQGRTCSLPIRDPGELARALASG
ncbi:MAG TPA: thioredoxin domain-containing protein, partial [Polyangiaceae bacterium]